MPNAVGGSPQGQKTALAMSTVAFTVCFAVWTIFAIIGIQIRKDLNLSETQFGLLVGTPILTGSLVRVVLGIWTDRYGGRVVFTATMLAAAVATFFLTYATTYTQVLVAASQGAALWPWHVGRVTELFGLARFNPERAVAMLCGPEGMMRAAAESLLGRGLPEAHLYLSMERNMQCGVGRCGHCQFGGAFVCRNGPVFNWAEVRDLLGHRGF